MAVAEENLFTGYVFTTDEYVIAATYTDLQRQHIQNQLSMYAQQKLSISAEDYPSPEVFIRNHEYHRGLIDAMRFLLELDRSLRDSALEKMREAELSQQEGETGGFEE